MLPVPLTPLLGRDHELEETSRLLAENRLLTITGAGGSGKTRLALELARRAEGRFPGGVAWLDLAAISDPALIGQILLESLSLREVPQQDVIAVATDRLLERPTLLVLDNCEHMVDACAALAQTILTTCPTAVMIATTREALGIPGEQTWLVPPLGVPDAVRLFIDRARAAFPSFAANEEQEAIIASICRRLDGIPLAIELAAARVRMFSVSEIADRLHDAFRLLSSGTRTLPRHRTIREAIDWSYRLLSEEEQGLLRRLAVFAGSFSLEAVDAVCGASLDAAGALVDKSLLLREPAGSETRYRLLETVRQFAAGKLQESGERDAIRERHARFFVELVEEAEPNLFAGAVDVPTLRRIDAEIDNIRALFEWAAESPQRADLELRMVWALHWYWFARGHFHEARQTIGAALRRRAEAAPLRRGRALVAGGHAAVWQGDWAALQDLIPEAIPLLADDAKARAAAHSLEGSMQAIVLGDPAGARRAFEEAVSVARSRGRDVALSLALYWCGLGAELRGDFPAARTAFEEALAIGIEVDRKPAIGHSSTVLGHVALRERKFAEAIEHFRRALDIHAALDDRWGLIHTIEGIGLALLETGDAEIGIRLLAAASAAWLQIGARPGRDEGFEHEKNLRIRQAMSNDRLRIVLASGAAMKYEAMVALARESIHQPPAAGAALRVRALGPLEIESSGARIGGGAASRELLVFLLCHPGGRTKDQIGAALWPDADPAKLRNNFHVTLHRLRKMLGDAEIVSVRDETYSVGCEVEFDVRTFEKEAREAIRASDAGRIAAAVGIWRGDFLDNVEAGEWSLPIRNRLRDLFIECLQVLGRIHMTAGDFASATDVYQRLVDADALDEQASRNLMRCLAKTGDVPGVTRVYRRLTEALRTEMGADPDPATTSLHGRLTAE